LLRMEGELGRDREGGRGVGVRSGNSREYKTPLGDKGETKRGTSLTMGFAGQASPPVLLASLRPHKVWQSCEVRCVVADRQKLAA